jgi:hypothetical protein
VGTSSARKAPVSKYWRTAKSFASRFASGKEASPPRVGEVVARYLTALRSHAPRSIEATGGLLPDVVRTAASLGDFYHDWQQSGRETALNRLGINQAASLAPAESIPALVDRLAGPGARLAEAVARAALIDHLGSGSLSPAASASAGICNFLGLALFRKFLSDLGEPLEFHAPTPTAGLARQAEVKSHILATIAALDISKTSPTPFLPARAEVLLELIIAQLGGGYER